MTDPLSLSLAGTAAVVAIAAGWLSVPRPPSLDAERWFKAILATLMRGAEEAAGGTVDTWEARVRQGVWLHPAVDDVHTWLTRPQTLSHQAGQADLLADLRALRTPEERARRLFLEDRPAQEAVLGDPAMLGTAYDPARLLGREVSWDAIADLGAGASDVALTSAARQVGAVWAVCGSDGARSSVLDALVAMGARRCFEDDLRDELLRLAPQPGDRLIIAAAGVAVRDVLSALSASAELRDRVLAVVSIGGDILGEAGPERSVREDWMAAHFTHANMDLEAHRAMIMASVQWLDVADPDDLLRQRFPEPRDDGVRDRVLTRVDLGPVPTHPMPSAHLLACAVWLVTGLLVLNARASR